MDKPAKKMRKRRSDPEETTSLAEFIQKYPKYTYRAREGKVQRLQGKSWRTMCKHNRDYIYCVTCGGHGICEHEKVRFNCIDCGAKDKRCEHGKYPQYCISCGGSSICIHGKIRYKCKDCGGKGICEHQKLKRACRECDGALFCMHGRVRYNCANCEGTRICNSCKSRIQTKDGFCITCHPDHIPGNAGASKSACRFLDGLSKELNCVIQHKHYDDVTKKLVGVEFRPPENVRKAVDGFIAPKTCIEYFGDFFHGHPLCKTPVTPTSFADTEARLIELTSLGYFVYFVWEYDYKRKKAFDSHESLLRTFNGKLEWEPK